jgi:hypothetical protein
MAKVVLSNCVAPAPSDREHLVADLTLDLGPRCELSEQQLSTVFFLRHLKAKLSFKKNRVRLTFVQIPLEQYRRNEAILKDEAITFEIT